MQMNTEAAHRLSQIISALRYPMILLVVFAHIPLRGDYSRELLTLLREGDSPSYYYISRIGSYLFCYACVPMFFLFSGYYTFYRSRDWWSREVYFSELKKRLRTLGLPYILWCSISATLALGLDYMKGEAVLPTSFSEGLGRLGEVYLWGPANLPLWYVRDLVIVLLFAPVLDWVSRRAPWLILPLFAIHVAGLWPTAIPSSKAVIYILAGALMGQRHLDMVSLAEKGKAVIYPLFALVTLTLPFMPINAWHEPVMALYVPLAMLTFFCLGGYIYDKKPRLQAQLLALEKYVFFTYVAHEVLILQAIRGFLYKRGWLETVPGYFLCGGLILGSCIIVYRLLYRFVPRLLDFSLGGRI